MDTQTLNIAQFNDVYQVNEQKIQVDGKEENIDVTKFASSLNNVTSKWDTKPDGTKDGLIIFSGDAFSPSIQTSVTRGRHMVSLVAWVLVLLTLNWLSNSHPFLMRWESMSLVLVSTIFKTIDWR